MEFINLNSNTNTGESDEQFSNDVLMGLCSSPKSLSAKYFYDDRGSELFQKITDHFDYYPTRSEFEILKNIKTQLPKLFDHQEMDIIELGVGDGHKSRLLIEGFLDHDVKVNYFPIDISEKAMHLLDKNIPNHDRLETKGVVGDYFDGLRSIRENSSNPKLVLFLGSNIGNFNPVQAQGFLRRLWRGLNNNDHVLIGFDLKKHIRTLNAAYNDSAGLTRDFNLNLLTRINRELGGNFKIEDFEHFGSYNPILGAMESYLISVKKQEVFISDLERKFEFDEFEPLHLEYSFKFLRSDIDRLGKQTGFEILEHFSDHSEFFVDSLWKVRKGLSH
ncbi:MAG: L-histidine N(alpha)-methyltransferase [Pseudomonadota bacterium]